MSSVLEWLLLAFVGVASWPRSHSTRTPPRCFQRPCNSHVLWMRAVNEREFRSLLIVLVRLFLVVPWFQRSSATKQATQKTIQASSMGAPHNPSVFVGIISAANHSMALKYRQRHRQLFGLWNSSKLCSLYEYELNLYQEQQNCQIIYSFILGIPDESLRTVQLEELDNVRVSYDEVWNSDRRSSTGPPSDWNATDIIYLNIQENMNAGKTPTYFYFATGIAEHYGFRFVVKVRYHNLWFEAFLCISVSECQSSHQTSVLLRNIQIMI